MFTLSRSQLVLCRHIAASTRPKLRHHCYTTALWPLSTLAVATPGNATGHGASCVAAPRLWRNVSNSSSSNHSHHRAMCTFVSKHYRMTQESNIPAYLSRKSLIYKKSGDKYVVKICPLCSRPHGNKASNHWKLYILADGGAFFCHRCGSKGSWFDLKNKLGDIAMGSRSAIEGTQQEASSGPRSLKAELAYKHASALHNDARFKPVLDYFTDERRIDVDILKMYMVGAMEYSFRPDNDHGWQDLPCMVFPWLGQAGAAADGSDNDTLSLHRMKIRALEHKHCMALYPKGGLWGLFGAHTVPDSATTLVLTEGELDAMSVFQATGRPSVSLPNGCRSLPIQVLPWLERFETIYLWTDNDAPGQEGAEKMSHKLGVGRCRIVKPLPGMKPSPKDANDALRQGCDLEAMIQAAAPIPHDQIVTFKTLRDEVVREVRNPGLISGTPFRWLPSLQSILKGLRLGEMTILTGPTGSGKTTALSQISLDLCDQGVPTLWGSFEIKNVRLMKRMLAQLGGSSPAQLSAAALEEAADKLDELPLYFMRFFGSTDVDKVLDAMDYAVYVHDVQHIILDNLQFMMSGVGGKGFERFDAMERALEKFRQFATNYNVHVSLVIHPRYTTEANVTLPSLSRRPLTNLVRDVTMLSEHSKEPDGVPLSLSSVFGTAKATQEADNVIIVQDSPKGKFLDIKKNRFDGQLGRVPFVFDPLSERFEEQERPDMPLPPPLPYHVQPPPARATPKAAKTNSEGSHDTDANVAGSVATAPLARVGVADTTTFDALAHGIPPPAAAAAPTHASDPTPTAAAAGGEEAEAEAEYMQPRARQQQAMATPSRGSVDPALRASGFGPVLSGRPASSSTSSASATEGVPVLSMSAMVSPEELAATPGAEVSVVEAQPEDSAFDHNHTVASNSSSWPEEDIIVG